ncbi:exported hypothetical protein [Mesorhizobium sp. ORS 3359]|nr:exported hypothetical protein [Mesorhizobium sp. ORS 3359]
MILSDVTTGCLNFVWGMTGASACAVDASNGAAAAETVPAMNLLRLNPLFDATEGWDMARSWLAGLVR